jgi:hypothetical protein
MSAQVYAMRIKFYGLPCWRPARWCWSRIYSWLASKLNDRPGLLGWVWRLTHVREWRRSSATSTVSWVIGTLIVYKLVERLGYGWEVNTAVSLILDSAAWYVHKKWVFVSRQVSVPVSGGRNVLVWLVSFPINLGLAILVYRHLGTLPARSLLGCYGVAMNPVMFKIRDHMVFNQLTLKKIAFAGWRKIRRNGMA